MENAMNFLSEEFLSYSRKLNPDVDYRRTKYENMNELLFMYYEKKQANEDLNKYFEKTVIFFY